MDPFHVFGLALFTSLVGYGAGGERIVYLVGGLAGTAWFTARLMGVV